MLSIFLKYVKIYSVPGKERVKVAWSKVGLIFRTELKKTIYNSDNEIIKSE